MKRSIKASLIATAIAMLPMSGHSAGLGAIHVFSGLGQPLRAEIELNATAEELKSLTASVAPAEAFRRANLQYSPAMTALRFAVERRGSRAVIKVSSSRPVNEPFVDLLLELNWAAGTLLREYTFLLDPVPVAPPVATTGAGAPAPMAAAPAVTRPTGTRSQNEGLASETYRVRRGDTLMRIADDTRPADVNLDQMLIALFRSNPSAFDDSNINRLRAGSILNIPDEASARAVEPGEARREVRAQAADFAAYRRRLAASVASGQPTADEAPARSDAGAITPKVTESAVASGGDEVRVSGSAEKPSGDSDAARLARLQALEEELAARDKALEEANSRLAALEESLRQMQQLLELRNQNLAQLQQQAGAPAGGQADVAPAAAPAVETEVPTTAPVAPATVTEAPAVAAAPEPTPPQAADAPKPPAPKPVAPKAPPSQPAAVAEPSFLQTLLDDPLMLAGGGGVLVLLLAYAGLKVRQRRQQGGVAAAGMTPSQFPIETNSVFGKTGGQSVNTGESSVLHTDFSQSGLSAIDTDEGVDPVAEADVYMAYGRDAQAEEILLDALKTDSSRAAIYLKLLEIYAQRNNLKAFEATATDLYSRTGGEGGDWEKAAEMGRRVDPDNPLYGGGASSSSMRDVAATMTGTAAAAAVAAEPVSTTESEAGKSGSGPAARDASASMTDVELEALPQIDDNALDFDLDLGLGLGEAQNAEKDSGARSASETELPSVDVPMVEGDALEVDLDVGEATNESSPAAEPGALDDSSRMSQTVVGEGLDFAAAAREMEFELDQRGEPDEVAPAIARDEFNLDATVVGTEEQDAAETGAPAAADLEKTTFDSSLLDFDFNLDDAVAPSPAPKEELSAPALDLSGIDLELEPPAPTESAASKEDRSAAGAAIDTIAPPAAGGPGGEPAAEVIEEVNTKLELARAYEEMGDVEGARELLDEVLREGSGEQRAAAENLLKRLA